jgi:putative oxidoreductase
MPSLITRFVEQFVTLFETPKDLVIASLSVLLRLWIAVIFWQSGILKIESWDTTILLFENEHPVPFLPATAAAFLATAIELTAPLMLAVGFGTRFAALALLIMTAVIDFTYQSNVEHFYWALALGWLLITGAGRFSWDDKLRVNHMQDIDPATGITGRLSVVVTLLLTLAVGYEVFLTASDSQAKHPSAYVHGWMLPSHMVDPSAAAAKK